MLTIIPAPAEAHENLETVLRALRSVANGIYYVAQLEGRFRVTGGVVTPLRVDGEASEARTNLSPKDPAKNS